METKSKLGTTALAGLLMCGTADAALDTFDYFSTENVALNGKNGGQTSGGVAWSSAWSGATNYVVQSDNAVHWNGANRITRGFAVSGGSNAISNSLVYISFDLKSATAMGSTTSRAIEVYNQNRGSAAGDRVLEIGEAYGAQKYGVTIRNYDFATRNIVGPDGSTAYTNATTLGGVTGTYVYLPTSKNPTFNGSSNNHIVVAYDQNAQVGDVFLKFWINPASETPTSGYDFAVKRTAAYTPAQLGGFGMGGTSGSATITDFAIYDNLSVSIPEPSALSMLPLGGVYLMRRARRRAGASGR